MKRKEYIDWLNEEIEQCKVAIKYYTEMREISANPNADTVVIGSKNIELATYNRCLNRFKGR